MFSTDASCTPNELLHGKWSIFYKYIDKLDATNVNLVGLTAVHAPKGYFYADPFSIKHNGTDYVFIETFDYVKGVLSVFDINKPDIIRNVNIGEFVHLSYPHVFKHDGAFYMIPESCHLNRISLYKAETFPLVWKKVKTLVDNLHSGDNTILYHNNKWWMFSCVYKNTCDNFSIYHSDSLFGTWKEHAKFNPNNKHRNDKISRCAGRIFIDSIGRLIRPAQYSEGGINGEGIILYHIQHIDELSYKETAVNLILANQVNNELRASHTFSYSDGLLLLDGRPTRQEDHTNTMVDIKAELEKINRLNEV